MKISVIVPAAGSGLRFKIDKINKTSWPKLYLPLGGKPLLAHSLLSLSQVKEIEEIIVVIDPKCRFLFQEQVLNKFKLKKVKKIVDGGKTRTESVYNGLKAVNPRNNYVLIHDGARPFLQPELVQRLIARMGKSEGIICASKVVPTIKMVAEKKREVQATLSRDKLWEAETPQLFRKDSLQKAYQNYFRKKFTATDDSSLLESIGKKVKVLESGLFNLKITTAKDLWLGEKLCEGEREGPSRFGLGSDFHRLSTGRKLWLGGISIPSPKGAVGHSDGDAILHAIIDGILGALSLGDIGELFPDTDPRYKNIASRILLKKVLKLAQSAGYELSSLDSTVILERPKLLNYKLKIRSNLAQLLKLPLDGVSVKAKTKEGLGPEGQGEAVSAQAIVVLKKRKNI